MININKNLKYYTFTLNKSYACLLNVEPSNLVFFKTYNTGFDEIIITCTYQNSRPLEIEDKNNLPFLLINKSYTLFEFRRYSTVSRTRKYVKGYGLLSFTKKYEKIVGYKTRFFKNYLQKSSP